LQWYWHPWKGENDMRYAGKKDKGKKEQRKKAKHNLKEKRKLKHEKDPKKRFVIPG
jgi:hypothetical protein